MKRDEQRKKVLIMPAPTALVTCVTLRRSCRFFNQYSINKPVAVLG